MLIPPDGSPVDLCRRLPERIREAALIHELLPAEGGVVDLGCGTGRVAERLARWGHSVTGVDNEPGMLSALRLATGVCADIATVDLGVSFSAVVLMSHLVNSSDARFVDSISAGARRHVDETGFVVVERYPPGWVTNCQDTDHTDDGMRYVLTVIDRSGDVLTAVVRCEFDGVTAEQRFSARDLDDNRLARVAARVGLQPAGRLDAAGRLLRLPAGGLLRGVSAAPEPVWLVADRAVTEGQEADDPYEVAAGSWALVQALRDSGR